MITYTYTSATVLGMEMCGTVIYIHGFGVTLRQDCNILHIIIGDPIYVYNKLLLATTAPGV
jgi:hypothetical protein